MHPVLHMRFANAHRAKESYYNNAMSKVKKHSEEFRHLRAYKKMHGDKATEHDKLAGLGFHNEPSNNQVVANRPGMMSGAIL